MALLETWSHLIFLVIIILIYSIIFVMPKIRIFLILWPLQIRLETVASQYTALPNFTIQIANTKTLKIIIDLVLELDHGFTHKRIIKKCNIY